MVRRERIPDHVLELIRERVDLLAVVEPHATLKKSGVNWFGCCPFHHEKTPSFSVRPDKGFFKCFGCGAGGDVFKFIQSIRGGSFLEAVGVAAEMAGVAISGAQVPPAPSKEDLAAKKAQKAAQAAAERQRNQDAAARMLAVWESLPVSGRSAYLERKRIVHPSVVAAIRFIDGVDGVRFGFEPRPGRIWTISGIAVPMVNAKLELRNVQIITDRKKYFPPGVWEEGLFCPIGDFGGAAPIHIVEGFATGASEHMATGDPVAVAFNAGNIAAVARALRRVHPKRRLFYGADDDRWTTDQSGKPLNPGRKCARAAARESGGRVLLPVFASLEGRPTDWNDLHVREGLERVKKLLTDGMDAPERLITPLQPGDDPRMLLADIDADPEILRDYFVLLHGTNDVYDGLYGRVSPLAVLRNSAPRLFKKWLQSPERKMIDQSRVVFDPAREVDPGTHINLFQGWGLAPDPRGESGCPLLVEHVDNLCGSNHELMHWFLRWLAYPLQNPGKKMSTTVVIHGAEGTGKNLLFKAVLQIYGEHGTVISQAEIEDKYNAWASAKLLVVANEVVSRSDRVTIKGRLKGMISDEVIQIRDMFLSPRPEENRMNMVFFSNEDLPVLLDPGDRRWTVIRSDHVPDQAYFQALGAEIDGGGAAAFYRYLLDYDLEGFNAHTKPFGNDARQNLIDANMPPNEAFFRAWRAGELLMPFGPAEGGDLYTGYRAWCAQAGYRSTMNQPSFSSFLGQRMIRVRKRLPKGDVTWSARQVTVYLPAPSDWARAQPMVPGDQWEGHWMEHDHLIDHWSRFGLVIHDQVREMLKKTRNEKVF